MTDAAPPAIAAATLILYRDRPGADADLLFVERAATMAFAPGAIVFPGGRLDHGDSALATTMIDAPDDAAARIAAIRETIEETGVFIGMGDQIGGAIRERLLAGTPLADVLECDIDLNALTPFARWRPSHRMNHVFDTRFYLARAPHGATASVDGRENVRLFWATARTVLADADAGRATVIFPTRCNLERLALLPTFDAAVADARAHPVSLISPTIERRGGVDMLCIPDGLGYPVTARPLEAMPRE